MNAGRLFMARELWIIDSLSVAEADITSAAGVKL